MPLGQLVNASPEVFSMRLPTVSTTHKCEGKTTRHFEPHAFVLLKIQEDAKLGLPTIWARIELAVDPPVENDR